MVAVGVLLNPIAGYGGALAMHGTDRLPADRFDDAVRAGRAERRLLQALARFRDAGAEAELVAAPGVLGASALAAAGLPHRVLSGPVPEPPTTRDDTVDAARRLVAAGVDVLVFAGGDGTATDLAGAVGEGVPVVGVPSGVKMHSAVFPRSAASAGRLLADFVRGSAPAEPAEVLDVGADDRSGVVGILAAPRSREALQGAKTVSVAGGAAARRALAHELLASAAPGTTWIIGPGETAGAVAEELGLTPTLRGVDVRHASGEVELDVAEERLAEIAADPATRLVLGVVGGQGFLLGRGNQQLSARVIDALGPARIDIVATADKVGGLLPPVLFVDLDETPDLLGYRTVRTGARTRTVMRVVDAAA